MVCNVAYPISSVVLIALVAVVIVGFAKGSVDNWVHLTDPDSKPKVENIPPISCNVHDRHSYNCRLDYLTPGIFGDSLNWVRFIF